MCTIYLQWNSKILDQQAQIPTKTEKAFVEQLVNLHKKYFSIKANRTVALTSETQIRKDYDIIFDKELSYF